MTTTLIYIIGLIATLCMVCKDFKEGYEDEIIVSPSSKQGLVCTYIALWLIIGAIWPIFWLIILLVNIARKLTGR